MNTRGKTIWAVVALALLTGCASSADTGKVAYYDVPQMGAVPLEEVGDLPWEIDESSGLARSEDAGVYWTMNDSGDRARIFAIDAYGKVIGKAGAEGVTVEGARNQDWEDLASDFSGNLIIADLGNNNNRRRNLTLYRAPMPDYATATSITPRQTWRVHYPEQWEFPPPMNNFDCEAVFVAQDQIYLVMKHRADRDAALYRMDTFDAEKSNALTLVAKANLRQMVTAADSWNNGARIAVLTYSGVWVFDPPGGNADKLFEGSALWLPIREGQIEAICFMDADTLLLTNEQRGVFHLPISKMVTVERR